MKRKPITGGAVIALIVGLLLNYIFWEPTSNEVVYEEPGETPLTAPPVNNTGAITISRVVDGDTVKVLIEGEEETIRIIGINTPETVDPRSEVECFGKEASNATKGILNIGEIVTLTVDQVQDDRDKYGRLLRYIADNSGQDVGLWLISQGYAHEYTYRTPYERQDAYKSAENTAQAAKLGLWGDACNGEVSSAP